MPDALAGQAGRCPGCERPVEAPLPAARERAPPDPEPADADAVRLVTADEGVRGAGRRPRHYLEFACPRCAATLRAPLARARKPASCAHCGHRLRTPAAPTPHRAPPAAAEPSDEPFAVVRVACGCGREVAAPRRRVEEGAARCPTCDRGLAFADGHEE